MKSIKRRVAVACLNSNGESDFHFFTVLCSSKQSGTVRFNKSAREFSDAEGYDPFLVYDEDSPAWDALKDGFVWESSSLIPLDINGHLIVKNQYATVNGHTVFVESIDETSGKVNINVAGLSQSTDHFKIEMYQK